MKFVPATYDNQGRLNTCPGYVIEDSATLSIWNEDGDITAHVHRPDGTRGHAYGGPVYQPAEFLNICDHCALADRSYCLRERDPCPSRPYALTDAELRTATALATKVGWI